MRLLYLLLGFGSFDGKVVTGGGGRAGGAKNLREQTNIAFDVCLFQGSKLKLNILHERVSARGCHTKRGEAAKGRPPLLFLPHPPLALPLVLVFLRGELFITLKE